MIQRVPNTVSEEEVPKKEDHDLIKKYRTFPLHPEVAEVRVPVPHAAIIFVPIRSPEVTPDPELIPDLCPARAPEEERAESFVERALPAVWEELELHPLDPKGVELRGPDGVSLWMLCQFPL